MVPVDEFYISLEEFHGACANTRAIPHHPVIPANIKPQATKQDTP